MPTDPRAPCIVGVATRTWHPPASGEPDAPEPLDMWEHVAREAARDSEGGSDGALTARLDSVDVVYSQTCQYDDPAGRLSQRLGASPLRLHYSGIGGTTPHLLLAGAAERILAGGTDVALVTGGEALATKRSYKKSGERPEYSFPPAEKPAFPWEAPFNPAEVAHEVFQAWLTFAVFDNARRAHLGTDLGTYRAQIGRMLAPMTTVAASNPDAWFRTERSADAIVSPTATNRMVGYPYTKYMVAVMDVDMAAAVILTSHEAADDLGIDADRRVYLRGWCHATDPVPVAEHAEMWRSPAMVASSAEAMRPADVDIDDVAHVDLYSCFASSLHFARDALDISADDPRPLTVTGGLPYHGGPGSNYVTHSIAAMARTLRDDPGSFGLVSAVGMHMTKHAYALYSTEPGAVSVPDEIGVQRDLDTQPRPKIVHEHAGAATVAAYSVVHGRDGSPEWGLLVCDIEGGDIAEEDDTHTRCYARLEDPDELVAAEESELVGCTVTLTPERRDGPAGPQMVNRAVLRGPARGRPGGSTGRTAG
ncbi:MAG: acetyl-CoA synthetase [Acidimicrobiia bacterium]|nr:acetyl-CoA synthetase [Acidimicrobiia bacterium]